MTKRPSLSSMPISSRTVAKPVSAPAAASASEAVAETPRRQRRQPAAPNQRDIKGVMARINRDGWKELSRLSTDSDIPLQYLFVEALNDLLTKHGYSPVIEGRIVGKDG